MICIATDQRGDKLLRSGWCLTASSQPSVITLLSSLLYAEIPCFSTDNNTMRFLAPQDHMHMQVFTLVVLISSRLQLGLLPYVIRLVGLLRHCDLFRAALTAEVVTYTHHHRFKPIHLYTGRYKCQIPEFVTRM